jgi:flagellar protein FliJ
MINDAGKHEVKKLPRARMNPSFARKLKTKIVVPHCATAGRRGQTFIVRCGGASGEYESMKSRETLIRLKRFQVDERRRKVAQIEVMIAEFERIAAELDREIKTEQDRAGIHDPTHFAYPTYAKAAMGRRENLKRSAADLKLQLEEAKGALAEAFDDMKKVELLDERDQIREREQDDARAEAQLMRSA